VDPHPALWALKIVTLLTHHHFDWHLAGFRARNWIRLPHFQPLKKRRLIAKVLWKVGYHLKRKVVFKPSFFSCHVNFSGAESLAKIFFINPKEKTQHFPGNGKVPFQ